jgi:hypothetical protein
MPDAAREAANGFGVTVLEGSTAIANSSAARAAKVAGRDPAVIPRPAASTTKPLMNDRNARRAAHNARPESRF